MRIGLGSTQNSLAHGFADLGENAGARGANAIFGFGGELRDQILRVLIEFGDRSEYPGIRVVFEALFIFIDRLIAHARQIGFDLLQFGSTRATPGFGERFGLRIESLSRGNQRFAGLLFDIHMESRCDFLRGSIELGLRFGRLGIEASRKMFLRGRALRDVLPPSGLSMARRAR